MKRKAFRLDTVSFLIPKQPVKIELNPAEKNIIQWMGLFKFGKHLKQEL